MKVIERLGFELVYFVAAIQHVSYYATFLVPQWYLHQTTEKGPGDLLSLNLQWKTISLRWCEKL